MKRLCVIMLALTMILSMAACGSKAPAASTAPAAPAASAAQAAPAEFKPNYKTLNIMVPFAAGGAVDLYSRLVAKYAPQYTDINVVITNMAGGSGSVGAMDMLNHKEDGTWMMATAPSTSWISTPDRKLPYTMEGNFVGVSSLFGTAQILCIAKGSDKYSDWENFQQYCKANPEKVNVGVSGTAGNPYYNAVMTNDTFGLGFNVVAFDGESEAMAALLGGHVDAVVVSAATATTMKKNDQAIAIITYNPTRDINFPEVPNMIELGFEVSTGGRRGFVMEKGTDEQIVKYWSDIIGKIAANPDFIKEATDLGYTVDYGDAAATTEEYYAAIEGYEVIVANYVSK